MSVVEARAGGRRGRSGKGRGSAPRQQTSPKVSSCFCSFTSLLTISVPVSVEILSVVRETSAAILTLVKNLIFDTFFTTASFSSNFLV